jgi:hypothetical protein
MDVFEQRFRSLYDLLKREIATDLEVRCPKTLTHPRTSSLVTFKLHYIVAAVASPYFAKFPPPTTGRILKNIDSDTFQQCISFMYLGEGSVVLTNDNVFLNRKVPSGRGKGARGPREYGSRARDPRARGSRARGARGGSLTPIDDV